MGRKAVHGFPASNKRDKNEKNKNSNSRLRK